MQIKTTLQSLNNQQTFLRLLIFSFVTVVLWVGFSIFSSQQKPQISEELQKMAVPLNPNLNLEVVSRIEQKKSYSDEELSNFTIFTVVQDKTGAQSITTLDGTPVSSPNKVSPQSDPPTSASTSASASASTSTSASASP